MQRRLRAGIFILSIIFWLPYSTASEGIHALTFRADDFCSNDSTGLYQPDTISGTLAAADQTFQKAKKNNNTDLQLKSGIDLAGLYLKTGRYDQVIRVIDYLSDSLRAQLPLSVREKLYFMRGRAGFFSGSYDLARIDFQKYYDIVSASNDSLSMVKGLVNLGMLCMQMGDYDESLRYNQKSFMIAASLRDSSSLPEIYNNLGSLYAKLGRYDSARNNYHKGFAILSSIKDTAAVITTLISMASMERGTGNYSAARDFDTRAYNLDREFTRENNNPLVLEALGLDYMRLKDYANADKYFRQGIIKSKKADNLYLDSRITYDMAEVFIAKGQIDSAEIYLRSGLRTARQIQDKELLELYYKSAADLDAQEGEYKHAFENLIQFHEYYDSLNGEKMKSKLSELEMQFRNDHKQDELRDLKLHHEMLELELRKDNLEKVLLLTAIVFGIIVIFIVTVLYGNAKASKKLVQKKNEELSEAVATKNRLFSIVAHDLKNPLNAIVGFSSLLSSNKNPDPQKVNRYAERIKNSGLQGFDMIEKLLEWSRLNLDDIHMAIKNNDLGSTVELACNNIASYAESKGINIENNVLKGTMAYYDEDSIQSVIRNLVSNAVKYSPGQSIVEIFAEQRGNHVTLKVADHGMGIEDQYKDKIFSPKDIISLPGTSNEKGSGLGLTLSREFVTRNNGRIWFHSRAGEGTTFYISLPVVAEIQNKLS